MDPEAADGCERCSGTVEQATRSALEELGSDTPFNGVERALAESAIRLSRAVDAGEDDRQLAGLVRELRATLKQLADSMPAQDPDGDEDSSPA